MRHFTITVKGAEGVVLYRQHSNRPLLAVKKIAKRAAEELAQLGGHVTLEITDNRIEQTWREEVTGA